MDRADGDATLERACRVSSSVHGCPLAEALPWLFPEKNGGSTPQAFRGLVDDPEWLV
jgi:hypothetical protein